MDGDAHRDLGRDACCRRRAGSGDAPRQPRRALRQRHQHAGRPRHEKTSKTPKHLVFRGPRSAEEQRTGKRSANDSAREGPHARGACQTSGRSAHRRSSSWRVIGPKLGASPLLARRALTRSRSTARSSPSVWRRPRELVRDAGHRSRRVDGPRWFGRRNATAPTLTVLTASVSADRSGAGDAAILGQTGRGRRQRAARSRTIPAARCRRRRRPRRRPARRRLTSDSRSPPQESSGRLTNVPSSYPPSPEKAPAPSAPETPAVAPAPAAGRGLRRRRRDGPARVA